MASNPINTTIPNVNEPFIDPRSGSVSRTWRLFLQSLFTLTGSGGSSVNLDDLQLTPGDAAVLAELATLASEEVSLGPNAFAEFEQALTAFADQAQSAPQAAGVLSVDNGGTGATDLADGYVPRGNGGQAMSSSPIYINASGQAIINGTTATGANRDVEVQTSTAGQWGIGIIGNDRGMIVRNSSNTSGIYHFFEYNGGTNNGSISWSGATTSYNTSSDYRLKDGLVPLTGSGSFIDALKCYRGTWKADGAPFVGMIAHEVQEVVTTPAVWGEKDGEDMQAMDYSAPEIIANMIAEIQSLRARVAALEEAV